MKTNEEKIKESYNPILHGIQGEVPVESAPLLNFITKHAGIIASCAIIFLLILGGMGIWNWHKTVKERAIRTEIAKIMLYKESENRYQALQNLLKTAPESSKFFIYMLLAQISHSNGNAELAADAYAKAASLNNEGALGIAAAIGNVSSLMEQSKYEQALTLIQELEKRFPSLKDSFYLQQLLADAAIKTGNKQLAMEIFRKLADASVMTNGIQAGTSLSPQAAYYKKRSEQIALELSDKGKQNSGNGQ